MLATGKRTGQEVADMFNVKVQVVRDLKKDFKRKQTYFINKRKAETRKVLNQVVIVGVVQCAINQNQSIWNVK